MPKFGITFKPPRRNPLFNLATIEREIKDSVREVGEEVKEDFEDVVSDWSTPVTFRLRTVVEGDRVSVTVGPASNADIWRYVDEGTRPHLIVPRGGGRLAFRTGYSARTRPGRAHVGSGTASGEYVYARAVNHPGTEAREFTQTIMDKFRSEFKDAIDEAIRDNV